MKKVFAKVCAAILILALLAAQVLAAEPIQVDAACTLTLQFTPEGVPISDTAFSIYRVAEVSADGAFTKVGDFRNYPVEIENSDTVAVTLAAYVLADGIAPTAEGTTDDSGNVRFSQLQTGLYLVLGTGKTLDGTRYAPVPFLVALPTAGEDGAWLYDVTAQVKFTQETAESATVSVLKLWEQDTPGVRPAAVTVALLQDGVTLDTVTLSADNDWRHTWQGLEAGHTYLVAETPVPEDYTVSVSITDGWFAVTNTYHGAPEETTAPTEPTVPEEQLPQTGQLWWPVPLMAGAGLVLFSIGWLLGRKKDAQ